MPKYRQLHLKTLDSFDFNEMPDDFTRVCWMLLMLILDSEGRGIYNMGWVRSKMFPIRQDISLDELQKSFDWLANRKMIKIYRVGERDYFYVPKWKYYQTGTKKEAPSNLPQPSDLVRSNSEATPEQVDPAVLYCIDNCIESDIDIVYKTYHENIGMLSGGISEKLDADIQDYTAEWVKDAILEATRQEKRSLAYVEGILKGWKQRGRNNQKSSKPYNRHSLDNLAFDNVEPQ